MNKPSDAHLPPGWATPTLREITNINPPLDRCVINDDIEVTFVPMRAVDIEGGGLINPEVRRFGEVKKGYTAFLSGDVIMAKITPCMENGKFAIVPNVPGQVCFGSTEFHAIRPEANVPAKWILHFLLQHETRRAARRQMIGGVGQMRVPARFLESLQIPFAPVAEQSRITEVLDELFSDLNAGLTTLERAQAKLKLYRISVLKAAAEGVLTAGWRSQHRHIEPAGDLLKRILSERRRSWMKDRLEAFRSKGQQPPKNWHAKYMEPAAPDTTHLPALPESWCWATIEQLASGRARSIQSGPFGSALLHSEFVKKGALAIGIDNVLDGNFSLGSQHRITPEKFERLRKFEARPRDVVVTVMSTVGRVCVLPADLEPSIITKHCYRISVPEEMLEPDFLGLSLRAECHTRYHIYGNIRGQTRPGINGSILKATPVALAPQQEQATIVEIVEDQLSVIDHLEADLEAKLKKAQGLHQAILHQAFIGKLVPQDPRNEPASELLGRIATERAAHAQETKGARRSARNVNASGTSQRARQTKWRIKVG